MNENHLTKLFQDVKEGKTSIEEGVKKIKENLYADLSYATVDVNRQFRTGFPEVIFCQGKTNEQIVGIAQKLVEVSDKNILATRAKPEIYEKLALLFENIEYSELARTVLIRKGEQTELGNILIITAGTADLPIAEEAAVTAQAMGNRVTKLYDSGVAGIHRLLAQTEKLFSANVIIVVAGMDGALPSVVGGLVDKPVIAVPTSIGYGASFGGLAALLTMLNSCAAGIGVVNIDNGFGAGYLASLINKS